jgi:hypothetical protein
MAVVAAANEQKCGVLWMLTLICMSLIAHFIASISSPSVSLKRDGHELLVHSVTVCSCHMFVLPCVRDPVLLTCHCCLMMLAVVSVLSNERWEGEQILQMETHYCHLFLLTLLLFDHDVCHASINNANMHALSGPHNEL